MIKINLSYKFLLLFVGICSITFLLSSQASAAHTQQIITISPTSVDATLQPGQVTKGSFQVYNQGVSEFDFHIYGAPYGVKGEEYTPDFTILPGAPNVSDWFKFSVNQGHMKPGESTNVDYTITLPSDTQPGGYYGVAFAETRYPKSKTTGVVLNERVGELFYLTVPGPAVKKGSILSWQSDFFQEPPLKAYLRMDNRGSIHYNANVEINVRDIFDQSKYTLKTKKVILPQTIRKIPIEWNKAPALGFFKINGTVKYLAKTENLPTQYILVMSPLIRIIAAIIIALGIIIFVVRSIRSAKRPKKKKTAKSKKK